MNTTAKGRAFWTPRQKLAHWWWGLSEKERQAIRRQVLRRAQTDPVFSTQCRRLLEQADRGEVSDG